MPTFYTLVALIAALFAAGNLVLGTTVLHTISALIWLLIALAAIIGYNVDQHLAALRRQAGGGK